MMHVETLGAGREIVLVHGWGLHGGVWHDLAARLATSPIGSRRGPRATTPGTEEVERSRMPEPRDGAVAASFRVVVPDLPGHGRSRHVDSAFTLEALADAVQQQLAGPAVWLGWSLGALVALVAARQFPRAVDSIVLIGATPRFTQAPDWLYAMAPETLAQFARELETDYHGTLARFLSLQAGDGELARETVRRLRAVLAEGGDPAPAALRAGLRLLAETDLRTQLAKVGVPALVLHGGRDRLAPPRAGEYLSAHLPHARFALIRSAGHAPFLSHPEETWCALEPFLHDSRDGGGRAMPGAVADA